MTSELIENLKLLKKVIAYERKKILSRERYITNKSNQSYYQKNKEKRKLYNIINKEQIKSKRKIYYYKNKQKLSSAGKLYRHNNKEKIKLYIIRNKNIISKTHNKYIKNRKLTDVNFKLTTIIRTRISNALNGNFKTGSSIKLLGCSIGEFKKYIEGRFKNGMTWKNHGRNTWHLDHIKPLASFDLTNHSEFSKACHYTNYQPLWAIDNLRKNDKLEYVQPNI